VEAAIEAIYRSLALEMPAHATQEATIVNVERFKQKIQLVPLKRNFIDVIDAFKVADFGILLMSADVEVDQFGINCLLAILNQGIVNVVPVVQNIGNTLVHFGYRCRLYQCLTFHHSTTSQAHVMA